MKRLLATVVVLASVAVSVWLGLQQFEQSAEAGLPVAQARQGEFLAIIPCRGEIKAGRAAQIYAPFVPNLRISWTAPNGDLVQQGDPIIRFDSSATEQELIQKQSELEAAQATLDQAVVQIAMTAAKDRTSLTNSELDVELAEIGTVTNEFVSRIEAEQKLVDLDVARQKLRVVEAETNEHKVSGEARIASLERQRDLAAAEVRITQQRIAEMELRAPLTGYFIVGTSYADQLNPQPFKVGDQVNPGTTLAVIPDLSTLLIDVTVEETDRGRMQLGDDVIVRVDALPELEIGAQLSQIAPLAEFSLETLGRSFRAYANLGNADDRLRPGMNGSMDVIVQRIPDAITVPAQAVVTRNGKPVVHVVEEGVALPVEVEVLARNPDEIAISGIDPDVYVAMVDPNAAVAEGERAGAEAASE